LTEVFERRAAGCAGAINCRSPPSALDVRRAWTGSERILLPLSRIEAGQMNAPQNGLGHTVTIRRL
jgi:hypothetical protein